MLSEKRRRSIPTGGIRMKAEQLYSEAKYALCEMPPDFEKAKQLLDEYRKDKNDDVLNKLLLQLVMDYPLNSRECEACEDDIECVKACPKYTLKYLPDIVSFFLKEGWNHRQCGMGLLNTLLYTTDGKIILETAKLIFEMGVDATQEDYDDLLGYIAQSESYSRCSWNGCEADADDLAEYYDVIVRIRQGKSFTID